LIKMDYKTAFLLNLNGIEGDGRLYVSYLMYDKCYKEE
jgi:hypothetical protein